MGRVPCCEKDNVRRGQWTPEEDNKLSSYIAQHGTRNWRLIPKNAGLQRCGKSCRLRWTNYLRPDLKHGDFSHAEEQVILKLHSVVGNRWSLIAAQLPGRTDNDVKNYWNTKLKKKLSRMGIDPVTHKPFSHLMAEISSLAPPQVAHLAEAALGCFKDEMLHLLTKTRIDFNHHHYNSNKQLQLIQQQEHNNNNIITSKDAAAEDNNNNNNKTKLMSTLPLSRVMTMQEQELLHRSSWDAGGGGFQYVPASPWSQSMCSGSTCTAAAAPAQLLQHDEKIDDHQLEENEDDHQLHVGKGTSPSARDSIFAAATDSLLWDIPSDDLINPVL